MDNTTGERIRENRPESYVNIHYVKRAGHHIHAEQPQEFNRVVNSICSVVDADGDFEPIQTDTRSRTDSFQEEAG